MKEMIEGN